MAMTKHHSAKHPCKSRSRALGGLWIVLLLGIFASCGHPTKSDENREFLMSLSGVGFTAELAITPEEMTTGLMHRAELASDHGMLFVYEGPGRRSFWMKNTHIPLDLGFFTADGQLQEIAQLTPYDLTPVQSRKSDIVYALEMNRGWFERQGLQPGAMLDMESVQRALEKRRGER